MGHQGDRADRNGVPLEVADGAHPTDRVDEAHAARRRRAPVPQRRRPTRSRTPRAAPKITAPASPRSEASRHQVDECRVAHSEQHQVHRVGYVGQRRQAGSAEHAVPVRVDQPDLLDARAAQHLGRHPPAERAGSLARPDDRDRPRLQHSLHPRAERQRGHRPTAARSRRGDHRPAWRPGARRERPACRGCRTRRRRRGSRSSRCRGLGAVSGSRRSPVPGAGGTAARETARRGRCCRRSGRTRSPSRAVPRRRGR